MEKICLICMNEKVEINLPLNLKSLKQEILSKYSYSESDEELQINYIKDSIIKEINNENDFKKFVNDKVNEISINIVDKNRIYHKKTKNKKKLEDYKNLRKELDELEKKKNNLEEEKNKILIEGKNLLIEKKKIIIENEKEYKNCEDIITSKYNEKIDNIDKTTKKINEIKKTLNIPIQYTILKNELKKMK